MFNNNIVKLYLPINVIIKINQIQYFPSLAAYRVKKARKLVRTEMYVNSKIKTNKGRS